MATKNPAYPFAAQAQAEQAAAKASGLNDLGKEAVNDAMLRAGSETVTLEGAFERNREAGTSPQTVHVHPESRGNATMIKLPGTGLDNAIGSTLVIGRVAKNAIDTPRVMKVSRSTLTALSWNHTTAMRVDGLSLTIPIASGVTTFLEAEASVECAGQSSTTALELLIVIGTDVQTSGKHSDRSVDAGAIGEPVQTGSSTQWHWPVFTHGRQMIGTDSDESAGVEVFVRVRAFSGGSGGPPPQTPAKFVIGNSYQFISDQINVRSSYSTSASINAVASYGTTGSIVGGPASGSGYTWWQINTPAGWVAEQFIRNTTPQPPPEVTTNRIRGGYLLVRRYPI